MNRVKLTDNDKQMLDGKEGKAVQTAMRILLRMAKLQGAARFIDVTRAHIDGCIYTGKASLQFAEMLADHEGFVKIPTTMNAISIDRKRWRIQGVDQSFAELANRLALAYERMGAEATFTCAPYQLPAPPEYGEHIAWAESNAIVYANSVLGARTNRYGDFMDICAALTGRVPLSGYHLDRERLGTVYVKIPELGPPDSTFYTVLGYLIGRYVGNGVPVIDGLSSMPSDDDLKAFGAAAAAAGSVGMFHMVGVTPEAATVEMAFGGHPPRETWYITKGELRNAWKALSTASGNKVDQILVGSPHFSLKECNHLAELMSGERCDPRIRFLITTNDFVYNQAVENGAAAKIESFGATFSTNICLCMLNNDLVPEQMHTLLTNSGKFAHYGPGLLNRGVYFGSIIDCVQTAITGYLQQSMPSWLVD